MWGVGVSNFVLGVGVSNFVFAFAGLIRPHSHYLALLRAGGS